MPVVNAREQFAGGMSMMYEDNQRLARELKQVAEELPVRPKGVVVISAHDVKGIRVLVSLPMRMADRQLTRYAHL